MRRSIAITAILIAASSAAVAGVIQTVGPDSVVVLDGGANYTFRTRGDNKINVGQTGFDRVVNEYMTGTLVSATYSDYLDLLPPGARLSSATLDFSGLFNSLAVTSTLLDGAFFYQPVFSADLTNLTLRIASAGAQVSATWNSPAAYDLWPLFQSDLQSGHAIDVSWAAEEILTADTSTYDDTVKNGNEVFLVETAIALSGKGLILDYNTTNVPEPSSMILMAVGLLALWGARRYTIARITAP